MIDNGFRIEEDIFSSAECQEILSCLERADRRAGERNLMSNRLIASMANDRRLLDLANRISGHALIPFKATLFNKTAKANWLVAWHQDTTLPIEQFVEGRGWHAPSRKAGVLFAQAPSVVLETILAIRIHLDASTKTNGPLRVIPRSHRSGVLSDDSLKKLVESENGVECLVGKGGVIAMRPLLVHASSKAVSDLPRRVLHIEYTPSRQLSGGVVLAMA